MIAYFPGTVALATITAPVVVFNVMPEGQVPLCATVALPLPPKVIGVPEISSFNVTFAIAVPPVAGAVPFSVTALIM